MKIFFYLNRMLLTIFIVIFHTDLYAIDIMKTQHQDMTNIKTAYKFEIFRRALELTVAEYGSFKHEVVSLKISAGKKLNASLERGIINTFLLPANEFWDENAIPIRIPVRLGMLSYRTLLVNEIDVKKFKKVDNLKELNNFTAGVIDEWTTTKILKFNNIKLVETSHFDSMFLMLQKQRFDYIPRGVYEINRELAAQESVLNDIVIEPTLALYIPTSSYVYVSKSEPRLAKRLEVGLRKLLLSGELKRILYRYFKSDIEQASLNERVIIKIKSPYHDKYNKADEQYYLFNNLITK